MGQRRQCTPSGYPNGAVPAAAPDPATPLLASPPPCLPRAQKGTTARAPVPLPSRSRRRSRATTAVEKPAYIIYVPYRPVPQLDKWLGVEVHLLDGAVMPQWPTQPGLPAVTRTFPRPKPALNPSRTSPHHSPLG